MEYEVCLKRAVRLAKANFATLKLQAHGLAAMGLPVRVHEYQTGARVELSYTGECGNYLVLRLREDGASLSTSVGEFECKSVDVHRYITDALAYYLSERERYAEVLGEGLVIS